jgi:2-phospho-L-lactate guanylyltransferase (CobY/MobA/RfbA family)
MFDQLRESIRALSDRLAPEERRRVVAAMRDAMVHAKMGLQDLREGIASTEARLQSERAELETVRRRQGLAAQIGDNETVAIAERFAAQHAERVAVLESKLMVQQQELSLADRELDEMASQLRLAASGVAPGGVSPETAARREVDDFLSGADDATSEGGGMPVRPLHRRVALGRNARPMRKIVWRT